MPSINRFTFIIVYCVIRASFSELIEWQAHHFSSNTPRRRGTHVDRPERFLGESSESAVWYALVVTLRYGNIVKQRERERPDVQYPVG